MRRRDYQLLSAAFKAARPVRDSDRGRDWYTGWVEAVESVGSALELDNAAFDYQLWLHNCGVEPA